MTELKGATVTITGGTGSFGKTMVRDLLDQGVGRIHVLSRAEAKQDEMRQLLGDSRVKSFIGDARGRNGVDAATADTEFVVHTTALKPLPLLERNPLEVCKTNIQSTLNVLQAGATRWSGSTSIRPPSTPSMPARSRSQAKPTFRST